MNDADRALAQLAATQRQVFTRAQARAAGLSPSDISYRVRRGLLVPWGPRTLHFAGCVLDYRGQLQAGVLDLGDGALVTCCAAAALHGLDGYEDGPLQYLVARTARRRTTVGEVMSTSSIERLDRVIIDGLPATSGTRTVVELVGRVARRELGNAIDSSIRLGLTAPVVIRIRLQNLGRRGRDGVRMFDQLMESAGVQSWLEREFLKLVRRAGLPRPSVQRVYRRDGRHIARVDFDFDPAPLVVEVGGRRGYLSAGDRQRQERRRNEIQLLGKTAYFFTTEDVCGDAGYVVGTLKAALGIAA